MQQVADETVCAFERDGFCLVPNVLSAEQRTALVDILAANTLARSRRSEATYGARNLLADELVREIAQLESVRKIANAFACAPVRAVRGLLFDKTPDANWHVPWHQDLVVAVAERHAAGASGRSRPARIMSKRRPMRSRAW